MARSYNLYRKSKDQDEQSYELHFPFFTEKQMTKLSTLLGGKK